MAKKVYEYELLKETKDCKIHIRKHPYYTTANLRLFKFNGELFGFASAKVIRDCEKKVHTFTHIHSGTGFPAVNNESVKLRDINKAFNEKIEHIGRRRFWEVVAKQPSIEEAIEISIAEKEELSQRTKNINELRKRIHVTIPFCRTYLMSGRPAIDLVAFDENCKKQYGDAYPENMSLRQFVTEQWGEATAELMTKVL